MKITKMQLSDLSAVVTLYKEANQFAKKTAIYNWTKEGLLKFPNLNLICKHKNRVVGAISAILKNKSTAIINDLAVVENYRHNGLGSLLMKALQGIFKCSKIKKISLWVHWTNARAIPFYYRHGFRIKKCIQTKNVEGVPNGEDVIIFEKIL